MNYSDNKKSYLLSEGFEYAGQWKNSAKKLTFSLTRSWKKQPVIYVFIDSSDQVLYIGRTEVDLESAMNRIKYGPEAQVTNHRLHNELLNHLDKPVSIEILAYTNPIKQPYLAEYFDEIKKKLIHKTSPIWNLV